MEKTYRIQFIITSILSVLFVVSFTILIYLDRYDLLRLAHMGLMIFIAITNYLINKGYFYDCFRYESKIRTIIVAFGIIVWIIIIFINMLASMYDGIYMEIYLSKITDCITLAIIPIMMFISNWYRYNIFKVTGE